MTKMLLLGKSYPEREYLIARELMKNDISVDLLIFSERNNIELRKLGDVSFFNKIYNFVDYLDNEYKKNESQIEEITRQLAFFEKKYNLKYNYIINCDRLVIHYPLEKQKIFLYLLTKFIIKLFEKEKYFKIVGELSSATDILIYKLAEYYKIKYIFMWHGRIANKAAVEDLNGNRKNLKILYEKYKIEGLSVQEKETLVSYLDKVLKKDILPDYEKFNKKSRQFSFLTEYKQISKNLKINIQSYKKDKVYSMDMNPSLKQKIKKRYLKLFYRFRIIYMKSRWDKIKEEKFLLVPLHYQPEASTMTFAQDYLDQIEFIKRLSRKIPINYKLYVKEHPSMFIYRDLKEYKNLKQCKNISLISPFEDQLELLQKSKGVVTLTNTTGFEAILYKKPVYIFGEVYYQEYDHVNKIKNLNEVYERIISNEQYKVDERNYNSFILATLMSLYDANLNAINLDETVKSKENIEKIIKIIIEN